MKNLKIEKPQNKLRNLDIRMNHPFTFVFWVAFLI
jgi:hypothetical protein